jgi:hypothetical protein
MITVDTSKRVLPRVPAAGGRARFLAWAAGRPPTLLAAAFLLAGLAAAPPPAPADDRDLLRTSTGRPYVFILFDTSGSMHWTPQCTTEQQAAGECDFACSTGDCFAPLNGDDPASKFYQAKEALFEVLEEIDDIDFGFATYNQDDLHLSAKHWLYEASQGGPTISGFGAYPALGTREVFGFQWACDINTNSNDNSDHNIGCYANTPADLVDTWERTRVERLPKGGVAFDTLRRFFVRTGGTVYRITYTPQAGTLGAAQITVTVTVERCTNSSCSNRSQVGTTAVAFARIGDFNSWDIGVERGESERGFFSQTAASDSPATDTCAGWDPNDDAGADDFSGYSIRWPTVPHPTFSPHLDRGDVLPLSWETDGRDAILRRLAPNLALGEASPDFRTARYFEDTPAAGASHLRLRNESARPLAGFGATPLGESIKDFRTWYAGCPQGSCPNATGWRDIAAEHDPNWGCRRKFLLILTDGDETCGGGNSACNGTAALRAQESIKTYVVAFGVQGGSNVLSCMANNGGTGDPIFPQNKQQLIDALTLIFGEIAEEARSFASAAVPSVQAQVADKIYLTSFTPLNGASVWDGHVDAYLKPLPLTEDGRPDKSRSCDAGLEGACHAWDAGVEMLAQAPTAADVLLDSYRLGNAPNERRVLYPLLPAGAATVPRTQRLFLPPDDAETPLWLDLISGMGIPFDVTDLEPAMERARNVIRFTLKQKEDTVEVAGIPSPITYVLGDIFHSTPAAVSSPERFRYFAADLYGNGSSCTDTEEPNRGYRCFFNRHRYRRKMLVVGANDGQLHAFEAGRFDGTVSDGRVEGEYDDGTGRELFSLIPRPLLPTLRKLAESNSQSWGVDGTPWADDVFIDPVHAGVPNPDEREWRTVVLTGLREGGAGYLAVDITQPDRFKVGPLGEGFFLPDDGGGYVPSCMTDYTPAACGPVPFPALLWEFTDDRIPDQDGNGVRDLGETWGVPNTGLLRVIEDGEQVDKFVAVFGGGMDPDKVDSAGDWLYIVDVETGKPIYKRQLLGSTPSEPAAVDTNHDGYLDTVYIGTTAGWMYKVDLRQPAVLADVVIPPPPAAGGVLVRRIVDPAWEPFRIFDTGGRPIYFPPAVIYAARLGRYALGFGTGDREDLWAETGQDGRFYLILDEGFARGDADLPLDESAYAAVPAVGAEEAGASFLLDPEAGSRPGWFMALEADERVITKTFSLSGITVFTSYLPESIVISTGPGQNPPQPGPGNEPEAVCAKTGQSRIFVVYTDSANAVMTLDDVKTRFWLVSEFVTDPFVEQSATKNRSDGGGSHSDELTATLREIMETLKGLFPDDCRFGNFTQNIKTIRSDTGVVFIAPVPICIVEKNWKEF